jgi:hypothetical protein
MPLNLSVGDGEFTPYLKYNAKAGRFYVKGVDGGPEVEVEKPRLAFDMANIKTGWIYYQEGGGPEKVWDISPTEVAPRPAGPRKFKRGFEVMVVGADNLAGVGKLGLREFSSTAGNVISAILQMHAAYEQGVASNPGKVPFYVCTGVKPINGAYGVNYEPLFQLHSWIDRAKVPEFDEALSEDTATPPPSARGSMKDHLNDEVPF